MHFDYIYYDLNLSEHEIIAISKKIVNESFEKKYIPIQSLKNAINIFSQLPNTTINRLTHNC